MQRTATRLPATVERRIVRRRGPVLGLCLLVALPTVTAQTLSDLYAPLALPSHETARAPREHGRGLFAADTATATDARGLANLEDGQPLQAMQVPRFLHPHHDESFGFRDLLVLGDYETLTFKRQDFDADDHYRTETWRRITTRTVAGRLVSVFEPEWGPGLLRKALRYRSWGVDQPFLYWGRLVVPGGVHDLEIFLSLAPPNIPPSPVVRISDRVQYASHVVNIREDSFSNSRYSGAVGSLSRLTQEMVRFFYEHFEDSYDVIASVSRATQLTTLGGFHDNVRNDISGIGLAVFDHSASWGSRGVLRAVEGYESFGRWATWALLLHEQGHQWGDFTRAWESLRPHLHNGGEPWEPRNHTPLLFPGAVLYGGALSGAARVAQVTGDGQPDRFALERTLPLVTYHPLTLYRMGLLPHAELPQLQVFRDQGILREVEERGVPFTGETVEVTVNDLMAADGVRRGPAHRRIRRAMVYVSEGRLAPKREIDIVNYFARRFGERRGVTSYDRFPSFREATGGLATMTTDIRPLGRESAPLGAEDVRCARVGTHALVGVVLESEVGGCLQAGDTITVSGQLTLIDRSDYNIVCLRLVPYTATNEDILVCGLVDRGKRFALDVTFPTILPGGYEMRVFAYWPGARGQHPLSSYTGAIEVLPR